MCGNSASRVVLAEARWYPYWNREDGGCPAYVQQNLLRTLLAKGDAALHEAIQTAWPLDAEAAFGVLPTRLRLYSDPRIKASIHQSDSYALAGELLDGTRWLDDPDNPRKAPNGVGGLNITIVVPEAGRLRGSENDKQPSVCVTQIRN